VTSIALGRKGGIAPACADRALSIGRQPLHADYSPARNVPTPLLLHGDSAEIVTSIAQNRRFDADAMGRSVAQGNEQHDEDAAIDLCFHRLSCTQTPGRRL